MTRPFLVLNSTISVVAGLLVVFALPAHLSWWVAPILIFTLGAAVIRLEGYSFTAARVALAGGMAILLGVVLRLI